jgi:CheY-like chemotaxis protein
MEMLTRILPKNIQVHLELSIDGGCIEGDASQIQQALTNLCLNAVDAMSEGGELFVSTHLSPGVIELVVRDSGTGMDPQTMAHCFEPFFTTKPMGKGTGLGLAMVHGTAQNHGGTALIQSKLGQGTEVILRLPALPQGPAQTAQHFEPPDCSIGHRSGPMPAIAALQAQYQNAELAPQGPVVLLVDDEPMVRSAARRLFLRLGYEVLVAESGPIGLARYDAERRSGRPVDLVFLDLSMPLMTGTEVLAALKKRDPTLCILVCSGDTKGLVPEALLAAGAAGYLRKPFDLDELAQVLLKFCPPHKPRG